MRTIIDWNSIYKGLRVELREAVLEDLSRYPKSKRGKDWGHYPGFAPIRVPTLTEALDIATSKAISRMQSHVRSGTMSLTKHDKLNLTVCAEDDEKEFITSLGIIQWRALRRDKYITHTDLYIHIIREEPNEDDIAFAEFERKEHRELTKRVLAELKEERRSKSKKR